MSSLKNGFSKAKRQGKAGTGAFLVVMFVALFLISPGLSKHIRAERPRYHVSIDTVNGYPVGNLPSLITSPVMLAGSFSASNAAGREEQYGIKIDWGDGTSTIWRWKDPDYSRPYLSWNPLDENAKDFSGTYNTNPDGAPGMAHSYASGGIYNITVLLFHQMPQGAESAEASISIIVHVIIPAISITKSGPAYAHEGDTVTYIYEVSNSGECPLTDISVTDDLGIPVTYISGDGNSNNLLDLAEKWTFRATYSVPTPSGDITNIATATGKSYGKTVSDTASWTINILHPKIQVEKSADKTTAYVGDIITYTIEVVNTGDCKLFDVRLDDTLLGTIWTGCLNTGESMKFILAYTVKAGDPDPLENTVTALGKDVLGLEVTDSATVQVDIIKKYKLTVYTVGLGTYFTNIYNGSNILGTATDATPFEGWFDEGSKVNLDIDSPVTDGLTRFIFTEWTGDSTGTIRPITITMDSDKSITVNYKTQYYVAFTQTGVGDDFSGMVLTVDGIDYGRDGHADWYETGASIVFNYRSLLVAAVNQKQYVLTGLDSSTPLTVTGPITVTGSYKTQYYLTMVTSHGTVSPGNGWFDEGSTVEITATPPSTVEGERYVWLGWTGAGSGSYTGMENPVQITVNSPITQAASWKHQYYLTVSTPYGTAGGEGWYDEGSIAYATLETGSVVEGGVQYVFTSWSGDASGTGLTSNPIIMNGPKTAVANWAAIVYTVTFDKSPRQGVITVDGIVYTSLPVVLNWIPGSSHEVIVPSVEEAGGTRYVFREWSDGSKQASRTIIADKPGAVYVAYYNVQHRLTVYSDHGVTTGSGWYDEGAEAVFSVTPTVVRDEAGGVEYEFKGWVGSGTGRHYTGPDNPARVIMTGPVDERAEWEPRMYCLKVVSDYGDPYGSGWYPVGSEARFGVNTPVNHGNGTMRVFLNWYGDISLREPAGTLIMVKPYTVIAGWDTQYLVVYNTTAPNGVLLSVPRVPQTLPPGFNVYAQYYSAGSRVEIGPAPETVYGAQDTRHCFESWAINGKPVSSNVNLGFTVDKPLNISMIYITEILLTVNVVGVNQPYTVRLSVEKSQAYVVDVTPASPFREWVRKDSRVTLAVSSPNKIGGGEWAVFKEWVGDAQGSQKTVSLKASEPITVNAVFFTANPVAESIPYSLLTGIVSTVLSRLIRRRREEHQEHRRYSQILGIMSLAGVVAVAAIVSTSVAMGYGINIGELFDLTNWAVVFTVIEAAVFLAATLLVIRPVYPRRMEIPAIYPNPYGV